MDLSEFEETKRLIGSGGEVIPNKVKIRLNGILGKRVQLRSTGAYIWWRF